MIIADMAAVHCAIGHSIGSGQCAALVESVAPVGLSATWRPGVRARGAKLAPGAVIATFDPNGRYGNHEDGRSHVAVWTGEAAGGLMVIDQWTGKAGPHPAGPRLIRFQGLGNAVALDCNNGDCFCTVEHELSDIGKTP